MKGYICIFDYGWKNRYEFSVCCTPAIPEAEYPKIFFAIEMEEGLEETWRTYKRFLDSQPEYITEAGTHCSNPDFEPGHLRSILNHLGYTARIVRGADTSLQIPWRKVKGQDR